jgi:hypothetical protein
MSVHLLYGGGIVQSDIAASQGRCFRRHRAVITYLRAT